MKIQYSFAKKKIQTSPDCTTAGFVGYGPKGKLHGVSDLYLRGLIVSCNDFSFAFFTIDALYFPDFAAEKIIKLLSQSEFKIPESSIFCCASHTHSAPNIFFDAFGQYDHCFAEAIDVACEQLVQLCLERFCIGTIAFSDADLGELFVNRRKIGFDRKSLFLSKKMLMLPNRSRDAGNKVNVILIEDCSSGSQTIVYNFGCHPVFNTRSGVSSDFPGQISAMLESRARISDTMFLQGFSGDIRPNYTLSYRDTILMHPLFLFKSLLNGRVFKWLYSEEDFHHFNSCIENGILRATNNIVQSEDCFFYSDKTDICLQSTSQGSTKNITIKGFRIGFNVFVSISAEVLSGYRELIERRHPLFRFFCIGCTEGLIGYLPTPRDSLLGGYEVTSASNYGWDNSISYDSLVCFENVFLDFVDAMCSRHS